MVKVFKKYTLNIFIVSAFFLSQIVSVHANYLRSNFQKEDADCVMKQVANVTSKAVATTTLYVPEINYGAKNGTPIEGKIEKVADPITIGMGFMFAGYAISFISSIIGWIRDIVSMFK
ncbi:hypothetical protein [Bartonella heixiaziensis]|uniref:hypothetical protein n=1 Tax=Bartonella heixiaziensis TaxID=1461000 RepID=UPI003D1A6510